MAFIPLAIEYSFWSEPKPEILCAFGRPIYPDRKVITTSQGVTTLLANRLENLQDELELHSCRRQAADWMRLESGRTGVDRIYDSWRWLRSRSRGETFVREHQPVGV